MVITLPERITIKQPLQETAQEGAWCHSPRKEPEVPWQPGREEAAPTCQDLPKWYEILKKNRRQMFKDHTENMRPANESLKV